MWDILQRNNVLLLFIKVCHVDHYMGLASVQLKASISTQPLQRSVGSNPLVDPINFCPGEKFVTKITTSQDVRAKIHFVNALEADAQLQTTQTC